MFYIIMNIVFGAGLLFCIYILIRNQIVFKERGIMSDIVFSAARAAIHKDNYSKSYHNNRIGLLDKVSYHNMVYSFTHPISKMWPQELQDLRAEMIKEK